MCCFLSFAVELSAIAYVKIQKRRQLFLFACCLPMWCISHLQTIISACCLLFVRLFCFHISCKSLMYFRAICLVLWYALLSGLFRAAFIIFLIRSSIWLPRRYRETVHCLVCLIIFILCFSAHSFATLCLPNRILRHRLSAVILYRERWMCLKRLLKILLSAPHIF